MFVLYTASDIALRLLQPRHAEALFALVERDRAYFRRFQAWPDAMATLEDTRDFLRRAMKNLAEADAPYLGLYLCGELVGGVGYNPPINWTERSAELFYFIAEQHQGKGLVTRASRAVINYAFRELGLHRIIVRAAGSNTRSWAVAERLGFHRDGILRDAKWLGDRYDDHYVYSLLRDEWECDDDYQETVAQASGAV